MTLKMNSFLRQVKLLEVWNNSKPTIFNFIYDQHDIHLALLGSSQTGLLINQVVLNIMMRYLPRQDDRDILRQSLAILPSSVHICGMEACVGQVRAGGALMETGHTLMCA